MINTMDSQNLITNNFGFVQQPVTVNQGMTSMPVAAQSLQPLQQPMFAPMSLVQMPTPAPIVINVLPNIPGNSDLLLFTPNGLQSSVPSQYCLMQNGNYVAPEGWSFVPRDDFFRHGLNMLPYPSQVQSLTPSRSPSPYTSRSLSLENDNVLTQKPVNVEQTVVPKKATPAGKRPHRAKQIKITKIHTKVKEICVNKGIFADENEVLRGPDVCRIHVKTWEGLDLIEPVLQEVDNEVIISRIALPFSMKNKFQKKGFICYLKVQDVSSVPIVQSIFGKYSHAFKKCDVALPTNKDPSPMKMRNDPVKFIPADFGLAPPTMEKRLSAA